MENEGDERGRVSDLQQPACKFGLPDKNLWGTATK